jgi:hypothetical protein
VKLDSYARYALMGALAISLACARNSEEMDDTSASGSVTATDTGATVRVKADTTAMDTVGMTPSDTIRAPVDSASGAGATVRPGATDSARIGVEPDTTTAAPGWPKDTSSGWSTPPDSSL